MDWFFWVIIAIVGLAILIGGIVVTLDRRRQLEHQQRPELAEPDREPDVVLAPQVEPEAPERVAVEPAAVEPAVPAPEAPAVAPPAPSLERPEAPATRWARLRRRLSSSNNALARALADLLSVDRLDADTWDDFETTLITSDLGVGPATELTEALRRRLAVDGVADPAQAERVLHDELLKLVDPSLDRSLNLTPATP